MQCYMVKYVSWFYESNKSGRTWNLTLSLRADIDSTNAFGTEFLHLRHFDC